MSKRYSKEEKRRILTAFSQRTESAEQFATRIRTSVGSIYKWQQELEGIFMEVIPEVSGETSNELKITVGELTFQFSTLPTSEYLVALIKGTRLC